MKKYSNTTLPNLFSEVCQDEATLNNLTIKIKDNRTNFVTKNKFDDKISEISILHSKILKLKNSIRSPKTTKRIKNNPPRKIILWGFKKYINIFLLIHATHARIAHCWSWCRRFFFVCYECFCGEYHACD